MSQDTPSETSRGDRQHPVRSRLDRALGTFGGFIIAWLGFVITRFFVAEAVSLSGAPVAALATVGSLIVGLLMVIAGVALAVGGV